MITLSNHTITEFVKSYTDKPVHAIFGDTPYGLSSSLDVHDMLSCWLSKAQGHAQPKGFMNQEWDAIPEPETFKTLRTLAYPGAIMALYAGTRTADLISISARLAGWERIDSILVWAYGTGFLKGKDLGRETGSHTWDDYKTHLTPAVEEILLFRNPRQGDTYKHCAEQYGTSAFNARECQISGDPETERGRYPSNLILCHHPDCKLIGYTRIKNRSGSLSGNEPSDTTRHIYGKFPHRVAFQKYGDNDGYEILPEYECHPTCNVRNFSEPEKAHYFFQATWDFDVVDRLFWSNPLQYHAKPSNTEKNAGLLDRKGSIRNDGRESSIDNPFQRGDTLRLNHHPTVKPLGLNKWIAQLIRPPLEYQTRIVNPFMGSGSETIGCFLAGWHDIYGVEMMPEFFELSESRIAFWQELVDRYQTTEIKFLLDKIGEMSAVEYDARQVEMFG